MTQPTTVLITGCSSGIGHATAERLVASGWTVYATARKPETLAGLEARGCRTLALDVTDEASMQAAVAAVEGEHGAIGALVNNAGYSQSGAIETVPMEKVRAQFETNVFGLVRLCQLVLPGMRRQRSGRIVNLSSMGGRLVFPGGARYDEPTYWTGLRPSTPSNVPLIGNTRYPNLFLNTGHGTLGWTMACGSGKALADIVTGRKPDVDFRFTHG